MCVCVIVTYLSVDCGHQVSRDLEQRLASVHPLHLRAVVLLHHKTVASMSISYICISYTVCLYRGGAINQQPIRALTFYDIAEVPFRKVFIQARQIVISHSHIFEFINHIVFKYR